MSHRGTPGLLKRLNRSAILGLLREQGPLSRSDLAKRLELSPSTVTRIVGQLIVEGLVFEADTVDSATGRKPTLLEFNYKAGAVVGVDVGGNNVVGVVADLHGDILFRKDVPVSASNGDSNNIDAVLTLIDELRNTPGVPTDKVRGIGVAVPAIVTAPTGVVLWAPAVGWRDLHLKKLLEDRFELPVFVENDVNLAALGESRFGCAQGVKDLVAIFIGTGIGSGLILGGNLYRGHVGAAGEVGYLLPTPSDLGQVYDQFGRFETLAAGPGIAHRARAALRRAQDAGFASGTPSALSDIDLLTARKVFEAARKGDALAAEVVAETVDYLAQAVANVAAILNPEMVVLGGGVTGSGDLLLEPIKQRMAGTIPVVPEIVLSELGDEAVVQGAVALAIGATRADVVVRDAKSSVMAT